MDVGSIGILSFVLWMVVAAVVDVVVVVDAVSVMEVFWATFCCHDVPINGSFKRSSMSCSMCSDPFGNPRMRDWLGLIPLFEGGAFEASLLVASSFWECVAAMILCRTWSRPWACHVRHCTNQGSEDDDVVLGSVVSSDFGFSRTTSCTKHSIRSTGGMVDGRT